MIYKKLLITILFSFSILTTVTTHSIIKKESEKPIQLDEQSKKYASLIDKLVADGFDRTDILEIFTDPRIKFLEKVLEINLINRDVKVDYSHFLNNQSINDAKKFLDNERPFLSKVEKQFKVEKEIVVSILCIESAFGKLTGKNTVFNVFSTLSLATNPEILDDTYHNLKKNHPHISFDEISKRACKKAKWAYQELEHLLTIAEQERIDVFQIKGSWAGAFGIAQFLPSSYLKYALDGNNDQKVRLFNRYDSMVSCANFPNGIRSNILMSNKRKRLIIRRYNNSTPYIDTVLKLSKKISS